MAIARSAGGGSVGGIQDVPGLQDALNEKADLLTGVAISSNTSLTASSHANRPLLISGSGIVLTIDNDAATGCTGYEEFRATPVGAATFTIVAGSATFAATTGTSLDSSTAVGGVCSVERTAANTFKATSPAAVTAAAGAVYVHASSSGLADQAGSTSEFVVYDWTLPAMTARMAAEIGFQFTGTGTAGTKTWRLRIGGTGTDGTVLWTTNATAAHGQHRAGFSNDASVSAQIGYSSGTGGINTATGATALATSAVDTGSAGVHVYLTLQKASAVDTSVVKAVKCYIVPGT